MLYDRLEKAEFDASILGEIVPKVAPEENPLKEKLDAVYQILTRGVKTTKKKSRKNRIGNQYLKILNQF